ncbi:Iroquois-class homeodomain protein IRX-6, partial [Aphelenchoides avenae]
MSNMKSIDVTMQPFVRYIAGIPLEQNALVNYNGRHRDVTSNEVTAPLEKWLREHTDNPCPAKAEKMMLAIVTRMSLKQ